MSTSTSLLIILYNKVNRDAALRSSKFFQSSLSVMVTPRCLCFGTVSNGVPFILYITFRMRFHIKLWVGKIIQARN